LLLFAQSASCSNDEGRAETTPKTGTRNDSNLNSTLLNKIKYTLRIVEDSIHIHHFTPDKHRQVEDIKKHIKDLSQQMAYEDMVLQQKILKRETLKKGWFWFLDPKKREEVDEVQLDINDQVRQIENIQDDINVQWRKIKPLYGVFSKMFILEMLGFVPRVLEFAAALIEGFIIFDLLTLVILGPVSLFLIYFWLSLGWSFLVTVFSSVFLGICVYWVFYLPFVIVQYNPTPIEFVAVFMPFLALLFLASSFFFSTGWWFSPTYEITKHGRVIHTQQHKQQQHHPRAGAAELSRAKVD